MKENPLTWFGYVEQLSKNQFTLPENFMEDAVERLFGINRQAFNVLNHIVPVIYVLDYTTGKYLFVSRQCEAQTGFSNSQLQDGGLDFVRERYHPKDLELFNGQIFKDRLRILQEIPAAEHASHVFSYHFRVKTNGGAYTNVLQRNAFVQSDESGRPLVSLGLLMNVDQFKSEQPTIQTVGKVNPLTGMVETTHKSSYYLRQEAKLFSGRETEVLKLMAHGFTSREIADRLFISEHTVINHKRSMHAKSNTQNAAALISYAFLQQLL